VEKIQIRRARQKDSESMLEWRNHPDTLRYFFDPSPVDSGAHKAWFSAALTNPSRCLLIGEDVLGNPVGVVRFDQEGSFADIAIYLVPERHGEGLGTPLLHAAVQWLKENSTVERIRADVLAANVASLKMFAAAGFATDVHRVSLDIRH
jgi:UDP-2,4-diacetamido-2,4,6-trideoxy-beta-L-altropyranose hydrolase